MLSDVWAAMGVWSAMLAVLVAIRFVTNSRAERLEDIKRLLGIEENH